MRLGDIASRLGCTLEGDPELEITGMAGVEDAGPGQLTFLSNPRYRRAAQVTRASAIFLARNGELRRPANLPSLAILRSQDPYLDFARALEFFYHSPRPAPAVHPTAVISPNAHVSPDAHIGPYCYIDEDVALGRGAVLHSFVAIYRGAQVGDDFYAHSHAVVRENCRIGNRVTLQNGAVVGGDGFGFAKQPDGRWFKIRQAGIVVVEDDVELQAHACVDRATVGETRIKRGAKLDDLVLVGHASIVGEDALLCGQVGLAGSTRVGNRCVLAGQVGAAGHLTIGDGAVISSQSGVPNDVPAGAVMSGYPAIDNKQWLKNSAALNHLPELLKTVRSLQEEIAELKKGA